MANINARSPYLVTKTSASEVTLKLWIYKQTQSSDPTSDPTTYTLTSTPVNGEVIFDIAPLVKDYFEITFDGNYATEILWVDYQLDSDSVVQNTAFYGYGYFEDGSNPNTYTGISNGIYNFIPDSDNLLASSWALGGNISINNVASGDSYKKNCQVTENGSTNVQIDSVLSQPLPIGQEVTLSFWVNVTDPNGGAAKSFQFGYYDATSTYISSDTQSVNVDSGWNFISYTFTVPDTYVSAPRIRFSAFGNGLIGRVYRIYNCAAYLGQPNQGQMLTEGGAGIMKTNKRNIKLSVNEIYKPKNETFNIGITSDEGLRNDEDGRIRAYNGTTEITSFDYTIVNSVTESDEVVNYLQIPANADKINLVYYGDEPYTYIHNIIDIKVTNICEPKYTPYKLTFVNKYGVLEDLWFFKNSKLSIESKEEGYRANIINSGSYSISNHQYKTLYKEAKESLTINSGFYPESYNEAFKQLLLSEQVWINYKGQTLPCKIKDSSISFQDRLTEKNINYTMNIEFAFDKINNVR